MSIEINARTWAIAALLGAAATATGCKDEANQVRVSCESRTTWAHSFAKKCSQCLAKAATPKCNVSCTDKEYSGKCASEAEAVRKEPSCEGVARCLHECKRNDCACEEACYEGKPQCKELSGKADACTTEVCDAWCR